MYVLRLHAGTLYTALRARPPQSAPPGCMWLRCGWVAPMWTDGGQSFKHVSNLLTLSDTGTCLCILRPSQIPQCPVVVARRLIRLRSIQVIDHLSNQTGQRLLFTLLTIHVLPVFSAVQWLLFSAPKIGFRDSPSAKRCVRHVPR